MALTAVTFFRMGVLACERNPAGSVDIRQGATSGRGEDDQEFQRDPVMLITICRLYDSYSDANRVVLMLEAAGLPASETSVIRYWPVLTISGLI